MTHYTYTCSTCSSEALWSADWAGDIYCLPCAKLALAHGHKHCHDDPQDCVAELDCLFGGESIFIACPPSSPKAKATPIQFDAEDLPTLGPVVIFEHGQENTYFRTLDGRTGFVKA